MPSISVIMPVFNGEKHLKEAIDSILGQTLADFEFIIINDGSTDGSLAIIRGYNDPRIIIINQCNQGVTKSLNIGLARAKGDYIARMDADDVARPQRFATQVAFLNSHPAMALCGSWAKAIDKDGQEIGDFNYPPLTHAKIRRYYFWHNPFIHSSVMFKKLAIKSCGDYDKTVKRAQDYELWGRIIRKFQTANIPEQLLLYRVLEEGVTKSKNPSMRWISLKIRLRYLKSLFSK